MDHCSFALSYVSLFNDIRELSWQVIQTLRVQNARGNVNHKDGNTQWTLVISISSLFSYPIASRRILLVVLYATICRGKNSLTYSLISVNRWSTPPLTVSPCHTITNFKKPNWVFEPSYTLKASHLYISQSHELLMFGAGMVHIARDFCHCHSSRNKKREVQRLLQS